MAGSWSKSQNEEILINILHKIKLRSLKQYEKAEMKFHSSLTSALDGAGNKLHAPAAIPPKKRESGTTRREILVGPRFGLEALQEERSCPCQNSNNEFFVAKTAEQ